MGYNPDPCLAWSFKTCPVCSAFALNPWSFSWYLDPYICTPRYYVVLLSGASLKSLMMAGVQWLLSVLTAAMAQSGLTVLLDQSLPEIQPWLPSQCDFCWHQVISFVSCEECLWEARLSCAHKSSCRWCSMISVWNWELSFGDVKGDARNL